MSDTVAAALIAAVATVLTGALTAVPLLLGLARRTKAIAHQVTPNGGNTDRLGDRVVRTEASAATAARLAGEAAARAATAEQRLADYRTRHDIESKRRDQLLDRLSREFAEGRAREVAYVTSLHELGIEVELPHRPQENP